MPYTLDGWTNIKSPPRLVEVRPNGRGSRVYGFQTVADAEGWLDSFLLLLGLIDCLVDEPTPH